MTLANLPPLVTVFGGSGFVGRHVVRALAKRGYNIRVAVRRPDLAGFLQPLGYVGQIFGIGPIPMAGLLGLITGMLAFIPNIGAITSGVLMVSVGFSAGPAEGLWAIFVYFFVQNVDGYLVVPYIARRTVDLAPAIVLAMQLIMGAPFGILGVLFADPVLATLKVALMDLSKSRAEEEGQDPEVVSGKT